MKSILSKKSILLIIFVSLYSITFFVIGFSYGLVNEALRDMPDLSQLDPANTNYTNYWGLPSKVYSKNGILLGEFSEEKREMVKYKDLPDTLVNAFIAVEDRDFYHHEGINLKRIFGAFIANIQRGTIAQGGSTITQQLARSLFLNARQKYIRKFREVILSMKIERNFSKQEILEGYFNKIYLGHGSYGIESATRLYFGKHVENLTLGECAILAGLPKAPYYYSPIRYPERAKNRQKIVLSAMVEVGFITEQQKNKAITDFWKKFTALDHNNMQLKFRARIKHAPYFIHYIRKQLIKEFGYKKLYQGGLKIFTTLNLSYQKKAESELANGLKELNEKLKNPDDMPVEYHDLNIEGALVSIDPNNGNVVSMVGGSKWAVDNQINRATQYPGRQPGSSFKPFIYAAAFESKKYCPASIVNDAPIYYELPHMDDYIPENYEKEYFGKVTFRTALVKSLNVATIKIMEKLGGNYRREDQRLRHGANKVIDLAKRCGITSNLKPYWSLALGAQEVKLIEMVNAYCVFANKGLFYPYRAIRFIKDRNNKVIKEYNPIPKRALDEDISWLITDILSNVPKPGGTAQRVAPIMGQIPVAGKTGTTNNYRDGWFIGYSPEIVTGVWVGYDIGSLSLGYGQSGGRVAAPIWAHYMHDILSDKPMTTFANTFNDVISSKIKRVKICKETGLLPTENCPTIIENFPINSKMIPKTKCQKH